jgi:hypothetical protein
VLVARSSEDGDLSARVLRRTGGHGSCSEGPRLAAMKKKLLLLVALVVLAGFAAKKARAV